MARYNNNKLQTQRNFQSIWHSKPEYISTLLKEDQLIREYIIGSMRVSHGRSGSAEGRHTMKSKGWKLSEIIIKRKVNQIHIAFQIQNKIVKERKRWTKNRLKNRNKALGLGLGSRGNSDGGTSKHSKRSSGTYTSLTIRSKLRKMALKKRFLFFQLYLMITELRKMYPNNQITFYVQKTKPLQLNANLINSWIIENIKKKKSYKRLLNKVVYKFKKTQNTNVPSKPISLLLGKKNDQGQKNFLSWVTGNLIYLYNIQRLISQNNISIDGRSLVSGGGQQSWPPGLAGWTRLVRPGPKEAEKPKSELNKFKLTGLKKGHIEGAPEGTPIKRSIKLSPIWWRLRRKYGWILFRSSYSKGARTGPKFSKKRQGQNLSRKRKLGSLAPVKFIKQSPLSLTTTGLTKASRFNRALRCANPLGTSSKSPLKKRPSRASRDQNGAPKGSSKPNYTHIRSMSSIIGVGHMADTLFGPTGARIKNQFHHKDIINPNRFNGLASNELVQLIWPNIEQTSKNKQLSSSLSTQHLSSIALGASRSKGIDSKITINQEIRSTWKLMRKITKGRDPDKLKKRRKKIRYTKQYLKGVLKHRKEFNEDTLLLLNYYKLKYLLSLSRSLHDQSETSKDLSKFSRVDWEGVDRNFLWQGMKFISFIQQHPTLLDHTIKCLISNFPSQIEFLTRAWVGYFDYIYHYEKSLFKWQGIRILLSGRVGYQKMGRAKKYSRYWGSLKNSSTRLPLQYSYSQLHTRYGVVGVKVFVR